MIIVRDKMATAVNDVYFRRSCGNPSAVTSLNNNFYKFSIGSDRFKQLLDILYENMTQLYLEYYYPCHDYFMLQKNFMPNSVICRW